MSNSNQEERKKDLALQPTSLAQQAQWSPEDWKNLVDAVKPLVEEYIQIKKNEFEYQTKRVGSVGAHNRRLTYSMLAFLLVVVAVMASLTWVGKVSGDALLFLTGTITGYIVIMVQNLTYPLFPEEPSNQ
jgi:uncharacterized membrane protein